MSAGLSTRPRTRVAGRWTYLYRAVDEHGQRPRLRTPPCPCCTGMVHPHAWIWPAAGRGQHRPGTGLPAHDRRPRPGRAARPRAVCEQPRGIRSRPVEGVASDAWAQDHPLRCGRSRPDTPSCRTCAAGTTSCPSTFPPMIEYASRRRACPLCVARHATQGPGDQLPINQGNNADLAGGHSDA